MANSATVVSGNSVFGLKDYGSRIISTLFSACTTLAALSLRNSNKDNMFWNPGTPDSGVLISGAEIPSMMKKEIMECESYSPLEEAIRQDDVQTMTYRPNSPTLAVGSGATFTVTVTNGAIASVAVNNGGSGYAGAPPTLIPVDSVNGGQGAYLTATVSGGQITAVTVVAGGYGWTAVTLLCQTGNTAGTKNIRPTFKWTEFSSPCYVYKRDMNRAQALSRGQQDLLDQYSLDLQGIEVTRKTAGLIQKMETETLFATGPTTDTDAIWDHQYGLASAIAYDNTYGGLDRTDANNYFWRAQKVTSTLTFTLEQLYQDIMFTRGAAALGEGPDVVLVGPALFGKYQKESGAYQINANTDVNVQAIERQFGFKMQVIKYNTLYVVCDMNIPTKRAYAINTKAWVFVTKTGSNFSLNEWTDQSKIEGGKVAWYNTIDLQYMLFLNSPGYGQIQYTDLN